MPGGWGARPPDLQGCSPDPLWGPESRSPGPLQSSLPGPSCRRHGAQPPSPYSCTVARQESGCQAPPPRAARFSARLRLSQGPGPWGPRAHWTWEARSWGWRAARAWGLAPPWVPAGGGAGLESLFYRRGQTRPRAVREGPAGDAGVGLGVLCAALGERGCTDPPTLRRRISPQPVIAPEYPPSQGLAHCAWNPVSSACLIRLLPAFLPGSVTCPPLLWSSRPVPLLTYFALLQPQWSGRSSDTPGRPLPQGLCTCCPHCGICPPLGSHGPCPHFIWCQQDVPLSERPSLATAFKIAAPASSLPFWLDLLPNMYPVYLRLSPVPHPSALGGWELRLFCSCFCP